MISFIKNLFKKEETNQEKWERLNKTAEEKDFIIEESNSWTYKLYKWQKVIMKSNEPENYEVWVITTFRSRWMEDDFMAVVKLADEQEYCGGHIVPHSNELEEILKKLKPMEQYIYLVKGNPFAMAVSKIKNWVFCESKWYKMNWMRTYKKICSDLWIPFEYIDFWVRSNLKWYTNDIDNSK